MVDRSSKIAICQGFAGGLSAVVTGGVGIAFGYKQNQVKKQINKIGFSDLDQVMIQYDKENNLNALGPDPHETEENLVKKRCDAEKTQLSRSRTIWISAGVFITAAIGGVAATATTIGCEETDPDPTPPPEPFSDSPLQNCNVTGTSLPTNVAARCELDLSGYNHIPSKIIYYTKFANVDYTNYKTLGTSILQALDKLYQIYAPISSKTELCNQALFNDICNSALVRSCDSLYQNYTSIYTSLNQTNNFALTPNNYFATAVNSNILIHSDFATRPAITAPPYADGYPTIMTIILEHLVRWQLSNGSAYCVPTTNSSYVANYLSELTPGSSCSILTQTQCQTGATGMSLANNVSQSSLGIIRPLANGEVYRFNSSNRICFPATHYNPTCWVYAFYDYKVFQGLKREFKAQSVDSEKNNLLNDLSYLSDTINMVLTNTSNWQNAYSKYICNVSNNNATNNITSNLNEIQFLIKQHSDGIRSIFKQDDRDSLCSNDNNYAVIANDEEGNHIVLCNSYDQLPSITNDDSGLSQFQTLAGYLLELSILNKNESPFENADIIPISQQDCIEMARACTGETNFTGGCASYFLQDIAVAEGIMPLT